MPIEIRSYHFLIIIFTFFFSYFTIPVFRALLLRKNIFEKKGRRKIHKIHTPSMGGVPMFIAIAIGIVFFLSLKEIITWRLVFAAFLMVFILGLRDDLSALKPSYKLINQFFPGLLAVYGGGLAVTMGVTSESFFVIGFFVAVLFIIFITNSINLVDGIDGLAGSLTMIALFYFHLAFLVNEAFLPLKVSLLTNGAVIAFLFFNWNPAKIFMGDTGALLLGFILSVLALEFLRINTYFNSPTGLILAVFAVPIYDTFRTFINRIKKGRSPFYADKTHVHHLLIRTGCDHQEATLILASLQVFILIASTFIDKAGDTIVILSCVGIIIAFNFWLQRKVKKVLFKRSLNSQT